MSKSKYEVATPDALIAEVRNFADREYLSRENNNELPSIRTRQEGYGYMAECFGAINATHSLLKINIGDALKMLSTPSNSGFANVAEAAYSTALEVVAAGLTMAIHAQNITNQLMALPDPIILTPMEQLIEVEVPEDEPEEPGVPDEA